MLSKENKKNCLHTHSLEYGGNTVKLYHDIYAVLRPYNCIVLGTDRGSILLGGKYYG